MIPSTYQQDLYRWVEKDSGSCVVDAVAGSGKTTTLAEICHRIPFSETVRVLMFNKGISDAFKARVSRSNVIISTYHSAGYQAIVRHLHAKIDTDKTKLRDLIKEELDRPDERAYGDALRQMVGIAKGMGMGILTTNSPEAWQGIVEHHDLDLDYCIPPNTKGEEYDRALVEEQSRIWDLASRLLQSSNDAADRPFEWRIDFDDQLYLPILWNLPFPQYDWVLVDEAQDTNAIQREILTRSLKPGGRVIAVGDPHQAIYGWRGASHDALELIRRTFNAGELPLSVCYRCASSIVEMAQTIVPQIEPAPDAPIGKVLDCEPLDALGTLRKSDAILCRNNAPLVKTAYQLIGKGIACQILGRDIGDGLKILIYKLHATDAEDLEDRLIAYRTREAKRYRTLKQESKAQGVEDRVQCVQTIIESLDRDTRTIGAILGAIDSLFGDENHPKDLLTLSTIHKAKGKEWPRVAIIRSDLLPSNYATQPWQLQQETNLQYVAWTRAQEQLWIMDDKPEWLKKKEAREKGEQEAKHRTRGVEDFDALNEEILGDVK